jgi:beta-lactamase class A
MRQLSQYSMLLLFAGVSCAQASKQAMTLGKQVEGRIAGFSGHVSLYAKNLKTGASYGLRENEAVRTASTIKLPIMVECFFEAAEGKLDWKLPVTIAEEDKVSGSGIVQDLSSGDVLPIRDLMTLMIVLSDNTATNLILDHVSGDAVNARMGKIGLEQTRVMRKVLGDDGKIKSSARITEEGLKPENKKWGLGRTTPREMVVILEKLYRGELVDKKASDEMLTILKHQRDHNGIARDIKDITVANKTGALDALRSDVGIVYADAGPIAIAITIDGMTETNWTPDNPGELLISTLSESQLKGLS